MAPLLLQIDFIQVLRTLDFTSEYTSVINLCRTCKSLRAAFAGHRAAPCTVAFMWALYNHFRDIREICVDPYSNEFLLLSSGFEVYDRAGEHLHFVVRIEGVRSVWIFCARSNYITAISNINIDAGVVSGILDRTCVDTGTVVLAPFEVQVASPWRIHRIPMELEAEMWRVDYLSLLTNEHSDDDLYI